MNVPAIEGGKPIRNSKLYYGHQYLDEADYKAVEAVLRSDYLTCGPKIEELEQKLCKLTGAKYAVVCSNGTAALHIAAMAAGLNEGDELITTSMTFAASANCALYVGAKPVFADINPETYNIDPASIKAHITNKTKVIVGVDYTGQACEWDEILAIAKENGLVTIEDAAHSIGTIYGGRPVGTIADMTTFSFHPVKTVTGGEGGAVLTDNDEYYERLLLYRAHGITKREDLMENEPDGPWYYEQVELGYNFRMTDIQAGLLISQLDKLDKFKTRRKELVSRYDRAFSDIDGLIVQKDIDKSDTCRHLYILRLDTDKLKIDRKRFFDAMAAEGICCNVHYIPVYYFPHYRRLGYNMGLCPNAEALYEQILSLPLYYALSDEEQNDVIAAVKKLMEYYHI